MTQPAARHRQVVQHRYSEAEFIRVRNIAAMAMPATSGATDAIGYLALGHVFTRAMTGNLVLLGISLGHRNGERAGRVLVSLACFMVGAALGARIAGSRRDDDPVWPAAITRALLIEAVIFVVYAACWWSVGARPDVIEKAVLLGLGAIALGIQSSAMQRFGVGLNTTFLSGSLTTLVGRLATGHRFRESRHHLVLLLGLLCGGAVTAVLVLHTPAFAPVVQLVPLAAALGAAVWLSRTERPGAKEEVLDAVPTA